MRREGSTGLEVKRRFTACWTPSGRLPGASGSHPRSKIHMHMGLTRTWHTHARYLYGANRAEVANTTSEELSSWAPLVATRAAPGAAPAAAAVGCCGPFYHGPWTTAAAPTIREYHLSLFRLRGSPAIMRPKASASWVDPSEMVGHLGAPEMWRGTRSGRMCTGRFEKFFKSTETVVWAADWLKEDKHIGNSSCCGDGRGAFEGVPAIWEIAGVGRRWMDGLSGD